MLALRVLSGPDKGKLYPIQGDSILIGRDESAGIQILDQGVSRKHAEIFRIAEMYFIRDLKSRNHTYLNEARIEEDILRIGDRIRIGNTVLAFEDLRTARLDTSRLLRPKEPKRIEPSSTIDLRLDQTLVAPAPAEARAGERCSLDVLLHLSHILSEEKNLSRLLGRVSELLGLTFRADHLYILALKGGAKDVTADSDFDLEVAARYSREAEKDPEAGISRSIVQDCLVHNRAVLTADASLDEQFSTKASVVLKQLRSVMCVPLSVLGRRYGALYIYADRAEAFHAEDLELASAAGIELGAILEMLRLLRESDRFFRSSIRTLVAAIEVRSNEEPGAAERVAGYCLAIAKELGLGTDEVRDAWLAGMLHDIGSILLTEADRRNQVLLDTKKNHYARELLTRAEGLERVLPAIEDQNERWDGTGSPMGKRGEEISSLGRILGVALELERLLTRGDDGGEQLPVKEALLRIREDAGRKYDPETVNALLIAYRNGRLFNLEEEFFEAPAYAE